MIRTLHLEDPAQRAAAKQLRASAAMPPGVASTVAGIIADVRQRGDAAVRELSERFDPRSPPSFRLSPAEIVAIVATVHR